MFARSFADRALFVVVPVTLLSGCPFVPNSDLWGDATTEDTGSTTIEPTTGEPTTGPETDASSTSTAKCGDGLVGGDEQCDDGNGVPGDACTNSCELARCGDGIQGPGEACDDGDQDDGNGCSNGCLIPTCGDGVVEGDEQCDEAGESVTCNMNCTAAMCGDGQLNMLAGEACDDGDESPTCDADCTAPVCGDGGINASAGELCDDGDMNAGDACSRQCAPTKIVDVSTGGTHVCVVFASGVVRCWGHNDNGNLGYGHKDDLGDDPGEVPTPDLPVGGKVVQVASGSSHICARIDAGGVRCWGYGYAGGLGYGDKMIQLGDEPGELPTPPLPLDKPALYVAAGRNHTCAVLEGGVVRCWGEGMFGALGLGGTANVFTAETGDVPGISQAVELALGFRHTCVLQEGGVVRCWGANGEGQLGLGHTNTIGDGPGEMPPAEVNIGGIVSMLAVGLDHTCALMQSGKVRCWGSAESGKLGNYSLVENVGDAPGEMPPKDVNLGGAAIDVMAGAEHTCALLEGGKVKCWGKGDYGALGYGNTATIDSIDEFPPPNVDLGGSAKTLWGNSGRHTCAVMMNDTLRCWGYNPWGVLGYNTMEDLGDDETPAAAGPVPY